MAQARVLSLEMLRSFGSWHERNCYYGYVPSTKTQPMYKLGELKQSIAWLESYNPPEGMHCMNERLDEFVPHIPTLGTGQAPSSCVSSHIVERS
jgi:hypothetical protein